MTTATPSALMAPDASTLAPSTPLATNAPAASPALNAPATGNPQLDQLKAQMADIIEPSAIGLWPLAWGWWVLIAVVLVTCAGLTFWLIKRHKANAYRRQALTHINKLKQFDNRHQQAKAMMVLVKRVALAAFPGERELINRLTGSAWLQWLNSRTRAPLFNDDVAEQWQINLYRPSSDTPDSALTERCKRWISLHQQSLSNNNNSDDTLAENTPTGEAHA